MSYSHVTKGFHLLVSDRLRSCGEFLKTYQNRINIALGSVSSRRNKVTDASTPCQVVAAIRTAHRARVADTMDLIDHGFIGNGPTFWEAPMKVKPRSNYPAWHSIKAVRKFTSKQQETLKEKVIQL